MKIDCFTFAVTQKSQKLPAAKRVEILTINHSNRSYSLKRYNSVGSLIGETMHKSLKELQEHAKSEFPQLLLNWTDTKNLKADLKDLVDLLKVFKQLNIFEREDNSIVVGDFEFTGFITDQKCPFCNMLKIYNDILETYFCPQCNIWLEPPCPYPECGYCVKRPLFPLHSREDKEF